MTRIDGSGIRTPSWMSARNESSQSAPKWMLWWAASGGGRPRTPATHSRHDGEYRPRARRPRRLDAGEQRAVRHREVGVADDGVGRDVLAALDLDAGDRAVGGTRDRGDGRVVPDVDARLGDRRGEAGGHRVHAALGHEDALDRVHVGDHGVEGQRLVRGETGVHRLEAEDPLQPLVVEERGDLPAEPPESTELDQLESGPPRLQEIERRVEVGVDEGRHLDPVQLGQPVAEAPERGGFLRRRRTPGSPRSSPRGRGGRTASNRRRTRRGTSGRPAGS